MRCSDYKVGMQVIHKKRPLLGQGIVIANDPRNIKIALTIRWADGRQIRHSPSEVRKVQSPISGVLDPTATEASSARNSGIGQVG